MRRTTKRFGQIVQILGIGALLISLQMLLVMAASSVTLYLAPASKTVSTGQTFSVAVRLDSNSTQIIYVRAYLSFPVDKLEVVSINGNNSAFSHKMEESFNNSTGDISIQRYNNSARTGDNLVTNVTFRARKAGTAKINFKSTSMAVTQNGRNELTATRPGTYTLNAVTQPPPTLPPSSPPPATTTTPAPKPASTPPAPASPSLNPTQTQAANPHIPEPADVPADDDSVMSGPSVSSNDIAPQSKNRNYGLKLAGLMALLGVGILGGMFIRKIQGSNAQQPRHHAAIKTGPPPPAPVTVTTPAPAVIKNHEPPTPVHEAKATPDSPPPPPVTVPESHPTLHPHSEAPVLKPLTEPATKEVAAVKPAPDDPPDMFEQAEKRFETDDRLKDFREPGGPKAA